MDRPLDLTLFAPLGHITAERLDLVLRGLLAAGFAHHPLPPARGVPLEAALAAFRPEEGWTVALTKPAAAPELLPPPLRRIGLILSVFSRNGGDELLLSTWEDADEYPLLREEFRAWAAFLVPLVGPACGWAGPGYPWTETARATHASVAALEPPPVDWLTVYGPAYVGRLGRDRLLGAPAWRTELLADGSVAVTLAPHEDLVTAEAARGVARHLGAPLSRDFPFPGR